MKTILRALAALALLCAVSPAWAATLIARDPVGLAAAVAGAQAGDTVKVVGVLASPKLTPKPGLTFDMTEAVAIEWRLGAWRQVRFVGGTWRVTAPNRSALEISGEDIAFDGPKVEGPGVVDGVTPEGYGLSFLGSAGGPVKGVRVTGGAFNGLMAGVRVSLGAGVTVEGSTFTRIRADGITLSGVDGFRLLDNTFRGFLPDGMKHPDAIQTNRPLNGVPVTRNGLIRGNRAEGHIQAYFVPDSADVTLEGNWSKVSAATGIGVSGTTRATLKDNVIETLHPSDTISRVDDRGAVDLRYLGTNIAHAYAGRPAIVYSQAQTPLEAATARAEKAEAALKASESSRADLVAQLKVATEAYAAAVAQVAALTSRINTAKAALD